MGRPFFKGYFHGAEAQRLPDQQHGFLDTLAINEGAIGGFQVEDPHSAIVCGNFTVPARNRRVIEAKIIGRMASDPDYTRKKLNRLRRPRPGFDA